MNRKMWKIVFSVALSICMISSLISTGFSYETKQPIDYKWLWEIADLDDFTEVSYENYNFHRLVDAQVVGNNLFLAQGSSSPSRFMWIDTPSGDILETHTFENQWNSQMPIVYFDETVILNFENLSVCYQTFYKKLDWYNRIELDTSSSYCIGFTDYNYIIENKGIGLTSITKSEKNIEWEYVFPESVLDYQICWMNYQYISVLERMMDHWQLRFISLEDGRIVYTESIQLEILRCHLNVQDNKLFVAFLLQDGSVKTLDYSIPSSYKEKEKPVFSKVEDSYEDVLWTSSDLESYTPSATDSLAGLDWRSFKTQDTILHCSSICMPENGSTLHVKAYSPNGEFKWEQTYKSDEMDQNILTDSFIQNDLLLLQYRYREKNSSKLTQAFWVDTQNGNTVEQIYNCLGPLQECPDKGVILFPNLVILTAYPGSFYMNSIMGYGFYKDNFTREQLGEVEFEQKPVTQVAKYCFNSNQEGGWDRFKRYPSFQYKDELRFFVRHYEKDTNNLLVECVRFDMSTKKVLPSIVFPEFYGFSKEKMIIEGNALITYGNVFDDESQLVCYDLDKGTVLWQDYVYVEEKIDRFFLLSSRNTEGTKFSIVNGIDGALKWSYSFPNYDTYFYGLDRKNQGYFRRNNTIISILDMKTGSLQDEILLASSTESEVYIHGDYLLLQTYGAHFTCIHVPTKNRLWEKDLGDFACCITKPCQHEWHRNACKGIFISDSELLTYDDSGIVVFDMTKGESILRYPIPSGEIKTLYKVSNSEYVAHLLVPEKGMQILRFQLDSDLHISRFSIALENTSWWLGEFETILEQNEHCFVVANRGLCVTIFELQSDYETQTEEELIEVSPVCGNYLFYNNNLIFQASVGTTNSDYYLLAYNTINGRLTTIQKGLHENICICYGLLFFELDGLYYCCSFEDFIPTVCPDFYPYTSFYKGKKGKYPIVDQKEMLPKEFEVLDLYYINQVLTGSFTEKGVQETIFVTGDGNNSKVGIMSEEDDYFIPEIWSDLNFREIDSPSYLPFRQSVVSDVDENELEEIVVLYHNQETKEILVCVWYYNEKKDALYPTIVHRQSEVLQPELLKTDENVYLQFNTISEENDSKTEETQTLQLKYQNKSALFGTFEFEKINQVFSSRMYVQPQGVEVKRFQFLENSLKSDECIELENTKSETYPEITFPPMWIPNKELLLQDEVEYVHKRNEYLTSFMESLTEESDFYKGIPVKLFLSWKVWDYSISLLQQEGHNSESPISIHRIDSLFPVTSDGKEYVVVGVIDQFCNTHVILCNVNFEVVDVLSFVSDQPECQSSLIVSKKHPSHFWIQSTLSNDFNRMIFCEVSNNQLLAKQEVGHFYLLKHLNETYFEQWITYCNIDAKGLDYKLSGYHFIDSWSGHKVDQLFQEEMEKQLNNLYCEFMWYQSFFAKPFAIAGLGGNKIELPDGREKPIYLSDSAYILQNFEFVLYCYNSEYK